MLKTVISIVLVIGLGTGATYYYQTQFAADPVTNFRTAAIKRGDLLSTISATGTVEPEEVIDVGAQVAGKINVLGPDPSNPGKTIDYGSKVTEGTVLAYIDDALYKAQLDQSQASLEHARADLLQSEANRLLAQAKFFQTAEEWKRAQLLSPQKAIAETDYIAAQANWKAADATCKAADANVALSKAAISQSEAMFRLAQTNLSYTVIKSPVRGVIIARRVNVGQTVVASLNAPSLFLIAKDLSKMQIWASVNEADIGRIRPGQPVRFTVDAYPGETFRGKVVQIRLNATMTQNVVTYTVVVAIDNSDLRLLPYLTANLQFEIDEHKGVLLVPNAALRWKPRPEQVLPELREKFQRASFKGGDKKGGPGDKKDESSEKKDPGAKAAVPGKQGQATAKSPNDPKNTDTPKDREERGRLWVKEGDFVRPMEVQIGNTDGTQTEVSGPDVTEDIEVVMGEVAAATGGDDTTNPFAPKLFKGRGSAAKKGQQ